MPIVEIVEFPGSDAFVKDPSVFKAALETLVKAEGCISVYHGLQVEDGRTGYLVVVWETYEHHKKLMEGKDYGQLVQDLKPALSGKLVMQHVDFDADSTTTFTSPATEWVTFTVKPEVTQEKLVATFKKLARELLKVPSCHSAIHGESREHKGRVVAALGWDSVEAHVETVKDRLLKGIIDDLYAAADFEVRHTNFVKFSA